MTLQVKVLVFERNRNKEKEIRRVLRNDKRVQSVRVARTLDTALDALLVGESCRYDFLISESAELVRQLLKVESSRFDDLSMVRNTGKTRNLSGGSANLVASVNEVMKLRR